MDKYFLSKNRNVLPVLVVFILMMTGVKAFADTYTFIFATSGTATYTADGTKALNGVNWTLATVWCAGAGPYGTSASGQSIGNNANPASSWTLSTSEILGTITSVKVYARGYNTVPKLQITVGGVSNTAANLSTTNSLHQWTGASSGTITIAMTGGSNSPSTRETYIYSIEVTYTPAPLGPVPENLDVTRGCVESTLSWDSVTGADTYLVEMCAEYTVGFEGSWMQNSCGPVSLVEGDIFKLTGNGTAGTAHIRSPGIYENLGGSVVEFKFKMSANTGNANFYLIVNNHVINAVMLNPCQTTGGSTPATTLASININKKGAIIDITMNKIGGVPSPGAMTGPDADGTFTYTVTLPSNANTQIPAGSNYSTFGFYFEASIECYITGIAIETAAGTSYKWGTSYLGTYVGDALRGSDCHLFANREITVADVDLLTKLALYGYTINDIIVDGTITWGTDGDGRVAVTLSENLLNGDGMPYIQPGVQYYWRVLAVDEQTGAVTRWSEVYDYKTNDAVTDNMLDALSQPLSGEYCNVALGTIMPPEGWQWVDVGQFINSSPLNVQVIPVDTKYCTEPRLFKIISNCLDRIPVNPHLMIRVKVD